MKPQHPKDCVVGSPGVGSVSCGGTSRAGLSQPPPYLAQITAGTCHRRPRVSAAAQWEQCPSWAMDHRGGVGAAPTVVPGAQQVLAQ